MIRYIIIDDEFMAHDIIKGYCDLLPNMQFVKSCQDALEAIDFLRDHEVDLIFLDLNMPKLKGFEFLRTLSTAPKVIVTTAYAEFAIEGYELNVVDYLLKPFSFERFLKAVNKATAGPSPALVTSDKAQLQPSLFFNSNKKYIQVTIADILFVEASGNYCKVNLENKVISIRQKISDLYLTLQDYDFIRVHKSFAVAKRHIEMIEGNRIKLGQHIVPIGQMYKLNVGKLLE